MVDKAALLNDQLPEEPGDTERIVFSPVQFKTLVEVVERVDEELLGGQDVEAI